MFRLLLLAILLLVLKGLDAGFGWLMETRQRHRMNLRPNVSIRHQTVEFDYKYVTNSAGFRGPETTVEKPEGTTRIAVIGDSFVAGIGVENDETLTAKLSLILNDKAKGGPYEVLNRGRPGSSTIREFDLYRYHTRKYSPDVVVLAFGLGNDLVEILAERTEEEAADWAPAGWVRRTAYALFPNTYLELAMIKRGRRQKGQVGERTEADLISQIRAYAAAHGVDGDVAEKRYRNIPKKYREMARLGRFGNDHKIFYACVEPQRIRNALHPGDQFFNKAWPRVESNLDRLRTLIETDKARLLVMTIPDSVSLDRESLNFHRALGYDVSDEWLTSSSRTEEAIQAWCRKHGIPYLDLTGLYRAARVREKLYFPMDGHFNPAGQATAATVLAEFLKASGAIELKP